MLMRASSRAITVGLALGLLLWSSPGLCGLAGADEPARSGSVRSRLGPDAKGVDVRCQVEGQSLILSIVEEGTVVKKGQLLCELDASWLRDALIDQEIVLKSAESGIVQTKKLREVAVLALREFAEGTSKAQQQKLKGLVSLAQTELKFAEEKLKDAREREKLKDARERKDKHLEKYEQGVEDAKTRLKSAEAALKRYVAVEAPQTRREMEANVDSAKSDEIAQVARLGLERTKEKKYRDQIAKCMIYAPADGIVIFPHSFPPPGVDPADLPLIEEGAVVRERQLLLRIVTGDDDE